MAIDNIEAVTHANWFGGAYQDPKNQLFTFAVAPNYLDLYPEIEVDPAQLEAWKRNRTGMLVGETMMKRFNWKVGQRIPLQSTIYPNSDGTLDWAFDIAGVLRAKEGGAGGGFTDSLILMHYDYFEESSPYTITADQVAIHTGTIRFVNYGFMIWSPEVRVNSVCLIQNLGVPSFPTLTVS